MRTKSGSFDFDDDDDDDKDEDADGVSVISKEFVDTKVAKIKVEPEDSAKAPRKRITKPSGPRPGKK
ncbi:MAG: hypothetical protein WCL00_15840 [Bacteroidota bacterium]